MYVIKKIDSRNDSTPLCPETLITSEVDVAIFADHSSSHPVLMKYYLVNYLILQDKKVLESEAVYIPLHGFANIPEFKQTIARSKEATKPETVVIKSYLQVSPEEYNRLNSASA